MSFIDNVLQVPSYGWEDENGELVVPTKKQLFKEAFSRINIFKSKKNWLTLLGWAIVVCMSPCFFLFAFKFFDWWYFGFIFIYAMVVMSTHGTIWLHRYCTHKAYVFSNPIVRLITQNLVIKTVPEETYCVSHHVHHAKSDEPGDPYNPAGGFLYCMLADVNHQGISKDLSEGDYQKASNFLSNTGIVRNTYKQYKKWGSITHPLYLFAVMLFNWTFWYTAFYFIGGHGLSTAMFTGAMFWFILVRAFNYTGHGGGKVKHKDGIDYDRTNLSINQTRPGLFSGEWHNNHHLYPRSARAGFLRYQLDMAWVYIYVLSKIGGVKSYHNNMPEFLENYHKKEPQIEPVYEVPTS